MLHANQRAERCAERIVNLFERKAEVVKLLSSIEAEITEEIIETMLDCAKMTEGCYLTRYKKLSQFAKSIAWEIGVLTEHV